jgi:hypothetical protein
MRWIRAPHYKISDIDGELFSSNALQITEKECGFLGGYAFNIDEDMKNPGVQTNISMHKALIQKTEDHWKTRTTVYEGNGEVEAFFNIGDGKIIALNRQVDKETLRYSAQFLLSQDSVWFEISKLNFHVVKVLGSDSPWLLAVGFPEHKDDTVYSMVTSDGARTWVPVQMHGFNPTDGNNNSAIILSNSGKLFRFTMTQLDFINLGHTEVNASWNPIAIAPQALLEPSILLSNNSIKVIGTLSDTTFGLWNMRLDGTGPNTINPCTGIPKGLLLKKFISRGDALYLIGSVLLRKNGEPRGIKYYMLRSNQEGTNWTDLDLPITSALKAVDFGEDGSIWAVAPGNRIQIFKGEAKN